MSLSPDPSPIDAPAVTAKVTDKVTAEAWPLLRTVIQTTPLHPPLYVRTHRPGRAGRTAHRRDVGTFGAQPPTVALLRRDRGRRQAAVGRGHERPLARRPGRGRGRPGGNYASSRHQPDAHHRRGRAGRRLREHGRHGRLSRPGAPDRRMDDGGAERGVGLPKPVAGGPCPRAGRVLDVCAALCARPGARRRSICPPTGHPRRSSRWVCPPKPRPKTASRWTNVWPGAEKLPS